MERRIELTKSKINEPGFSDLKKVQRKRIKRKLKNLEIVKKKFDKIKEKSNKNMKNGLTKHNVNDSEEEVATTKESTKEIKEIKDSEMGQIDDEKVEEIIGNINVDKNNNDNSNNNNNNENNIKMIELIKNNNNNHGTIKYYAQRYRLFSRYDQGIILDDESWFSVTPELIAQHIADRCRCNTIVDAFCGAGGNTIQFSFTCNYVVSVDLDPMKILMAKHNSLVYGHNNENTNIEFVNCDAMRLPNIKADVIFLSPPWGGPNYTGSSIFHLDSMTPNGFEIFKNAIKITPNIVYFLPKNTSKVDIAKLSLISKENGGSDYCEVEENYINEKLKTITLYFGSLINNNKYYN